MEYFNNQKRDWRISQCCQFFNPKLVKLYNPGTVTKTTALTASGKQKVQEKALANLDKLYATLENYFAKQPINLRSFRISSYLLPCYTIPETQPWYLEIEEQLYSKFKRIGESAKKHNIRLSTHPGQYTVLGSNNPEVVKNSIIDLEYHSLFGIMAGLEPEHFTVNIHLSGVYGGSRQAGIKRFATNFNYLTDYTKRCLAVENEDKQNSYDIEHVLELCQIIPTRATLDTHHYDCWGKKQRPYLTVNHDLFKESVKTWKNIRPLFHISQTKIDANRINEHSEILHDKDLLSIFIPMLEYADFDIEAKNKEVAVLDAYNYILEEEYYAGEKLTAY